MFSYWCLLGETEDRKFLWCYLEFTWNQSDCMIYPHMQLAVVPNLFEPPHSSGWKIVMITRVGAAQMSCLLNICVKACPFPILTFSPTLVSTAQHDPPAVSFFLHTSPPGLTPVLNLFFCHPSLLSAVSPVHEFIRQLPFSSYLNLVANSLAATVHWMLTWILTNWICSWTKGPKFSE